MLLADFVLPLLPSSQQFSWKLEVGGKYLKPNPCLNPQKTSRSAETQLELGAGSMDESNRTSEFTAGGRFNVSQVTGGSLCQS